MGIFFMVCEAQIIENPVFDRTDVPAFHVNKVEITKDTTYLYCSYKAEGGSWANISKETYLRDVNTNKIYPLLKCDGLPYGPQKESFTYSKRCEVKLYFKSIRNAKKIELIEDPNGKAFNVYGIDLENQFKESFTENYLNRLLSMSSFYDSASDTIKAIQYKNEEVEASKYIHGIKSEAFLVSLLGLAIIYDKYQHFSDAIRIMEKVTELHGEIWGAQDADYALQLRTLAQFYSHAGLFEIAIKKIKDSISKYEELKIFDEQYAIALRFLSDNYELSGDERSAIEYQKKAISIRKLIGESDGYLEEMTNMIIQGVSDNRVEIVEKELVNLPEFVDTTSNAFDSILKTLTDRLITQEDNKKALFYCDRSLALLEKNVDRNIIKIAEVRGNKCRILRRLNLYHESIQIGEKAKRTFDSLQVTPFVYRNILEDIAWCYGMYYDYEKAILYQNQLVEMLENSDDWISYAGALGSLGEYYQYKEDLDKAEEIIRKGISVISNRNPQDMVNALLERGEITYAHYSRNLDIIKWHSMIVKGSLLNSLSMVCFKKANYSEAIKARQKSCKNDLEMKDSVAYFSGLILLSEFYYYNKQFQKSIDAAKESVKLINRYKAVLNDQKEFDYLSISYLQMAVSYFKLNNYNQATHYLKQCIALSENSNNIDAKTLCRTIASLVCYDSMDYNKAEVFCSEALDILRNEIIKQITSMKKEQKERMWSKYEYAFIHYRRIIVKGEWNRELNSKLYNYTLFSKSLMLDSECSNDEDAKKRMRTNWKDIQSVLADQDIAIEFISTAEDSIFRSYHALIIDKKCEYPNMITLFHESYLANIKRHRNDNIVNIVGDLVWKPILNQYSNVKNIYFSPDGILHALPIEYSSVDDIGDMMDCFNIYRLTSTKEIIIQERNPKVGSAVLYGGLDYDMLATELLHNNESNINSYLRSINERGGFEPLINTLEEVEEICTILKKNKVLTTLFTGKNGTEDSFVGFSGKDINMLHLSTHGMYVGPSSVEQKKKESNFDFLELITNEKDPVKEDIVLTHSFLVMSGGNKLSHRETIGLGENDGILTASEISQLDLRSVDIVVLSACETGLGDIKNGGVYGLQRGFKNAGVNTILMSLDKVDDQATKILMVEFYRNLMNGKSKHQSLKDAQTYLRQVDDGKYNKPEYWASFIMLDGLN